VNTEGGVVTNLRATAAARVVNRQWRRQSVKTGRSLQVTMSTRQVSGHSVYAFSKWNYTGSARATATAQAFSKVIWPDEPSWCQ